MASSDLKDRAHRLVDRLSPSGVEALLNYAASLESGGRPRGISGRAMIDAAPTLSEAEAREMMEAIRESDQYGPTPVGLPGRDLLEFAGMLTPDEAEKMRRDIEAACERVPEDE